MPHLMVSRGIPFRCKLGSVCLRRVAVSSARNAVQVPETYEAG